MTVTVERLAAAAHLSALVELLTDTVASGASIGFLAPLAPTAAEAYWKALPPDTLLWGAWVDGRLEGSVQLHLATKENGLHRAEIAKLMVHRRARRQGLGRALMQAAEAEAKKLHRTTLVLDTRQGDPSEQLYRSLGWQLAGVIPAYARNALDGALHATAIYYKVS